MENPDTREHLPRTTVAETGFPSPGQYFSETSLLSLASVLTLILVVFFGFNKEWYFQTPSYLLFITGMIYRPALRSWVFWIALALLGSIALTLNWMTADNHKYLFVYWLWVMTFVYMAGNEDKAKTILRFNARFFLVFIFLAAALQKGLSPSYMDSSFFELRLLNDDRMHAFGAILGVGQDTVSNTRELTAQLMNPYIDVENNAVAIPTTDHTRLIGQWITWYDFYIQIAIGVLFLFGRRLTDLAGHVLLLFFVFTTYLPAPVYGFGWTLSVCGIILAKDSFKKITLAYLVSFLAIFAYGLPWRDAVLALLWK